MAEYSSLERLAEEMWLYPSKAMRGSVASQTGAVEGFVAHACSGFNKVYLLRVVMYSITVIHVHLRTHFGRTMFASLCNMSTLYLTFWLKLLFFVLFGGQYLGIKSLCC